MPDAPTATVLPAASPPAPAAPPDHTPRSPRWLAALGLVLLTCAAYLPVLRNGFIWDDDAHVTNNPLIRSAAGLKPMWLDRTALPQYYPLTHVTFWVEYHLWGLRPQGYHVDNVLLHAAAALLAWRLLCRLRAPGAWLAAALFAVHPLNVESVAWATERKNVLSLVLYLASLAVYLTRVAKVDAPPIATGEPSTPQRRRAAFAYVISFLLFLAALLAKTVTCTLPVAALIVIWWKRGGRIARRDVLPLVPFFLVGAALGLNTASLERTHVGASGPLWDFSFAQRCLIAGRAAWFYAAKLAWPHPLIFVYPRWTLDAASPVQWLAPAGVVAVVAALGVGRRRVGRGPLAAVLFFLVSLFPALGFSDVYPMRFSFVADHFQYAAGIGLLALASAGLWRWVPGRAARAARAAVAVPVLLILAALTYRRIDAYRSVESLWLDTIAQNPTCTMARMNVADLYNHQQRLPDAEAQYRAILAYAPDDAGALINLGNLLVATGRPDEAERLYLAAVAVGEDAQARINLGHIAEGRHDPAAAEQNYAIAARLRPDWGEPFYRAGKLADARGDARRARDLYRRAIAAEPTHVEAHLNLGVLLARQGNLPAAADQFRAAVALSPRSVAAREDLINALVPLHADAEAEAQIDALLALDPADARAYNSRGLLAAARHDYAAAEAAFARAVELKPNFATARANLAAAQAARRSSSRAATQSAP